jgi:hypothetical protein
MQVKGVVQSLNINIGGGLVIFKRLGGGLVIRRNFLAGYFNADKTLEML